MEQPMQATADPSSAQTSRTSSVSPGFSRRRLPKVHKKNERGETPLHVAARKGEHRQCKKLIQEGAVINARDYAGWTPLHEACYHGHVKVAKLLISCEADVNALSDCDDTPLHDAVTSGNEKLVWLLLHSGAIRDRSDNMGKRPIDICRPEHSGIRNLLTAANIPEHCSVDDSPSLSPAHPSQANDSLQPLTVNLAQFSTEKQFVISPRSDDSLVSTEIFLRERNVETSEEIRLQSQGSHEPINSQEHVTESTKTNDDAPQKSEELRRETHREFEEIRHSSWHDDSNIPIKTDDVQSGLSAFEFDEDSALPGGQREGSRSVISESMETETRRVGRPRGSTRVERLSPQQHSAQKSSSAEKRKQRGRKRGRGMATTASSSALITHSSQPDDVYEFRSSPESDVGISQKMNITMGDVERELSESPSSKRQRFGQMSTVTVPTLNSIQVPPQTAPIGVTHENMPASDKEGLDVTPNIGEQTDEKNDATIDRKVPPLRISLPRTPSEDGAAVASVTEDTATVTTGSGVVRRNTRATKSQGKKIQSPEESNSNVCDESVQRVTRSKLRQAGRQLRDQPAISYDSSAKRKSGSWRRGSTATASPMPAPSVAASDDQTMSSNDAADRIDAEDGTQLEATTSKEDENALLALSLMKKNSYEGFRGFRSLIEERWIKDATEARNIPELPPNYNNYMILQGNYVKASSPDSLPPQVKTDVEFIEKLTAKLRSLHSDQQEKRRNMELYQQVERERLQMQAESEILRMLTRKANEGRESFSAMRIIRETDLYNTGFLEVKPKELSVMEIPEIKSKYQKLAEAMRRRQQMESDALHAEQVFAWNAAIQRSEDAALLSLKNEVPRVLVKTLVLNF